MSGSGSPRGGSSGASRLTGFPAGQSGRPASRALFGDWSAAEATGRTASPGVSCMRGGGFGKENGSGCGEAVAAAAAESPPDILAAGPAVRSSSPPLLASATGTAGGGKDPGGRERPRAGAGEPQRKGGSLGRERGGSEQRRLPERAGRCRRAKGLRPNGPQSSRGGKWLRRGPSGGDAGKELTWSGGGN